MRRRAVPIVLACLVLAAPAGAQDAPAPPPAPVRKATGNPRLDRGLDLVAAHVAGDATEFARLAALADLDPFDVAFAMWIHAIYPATKAEAPTILEATRRFATDVGGQIDGCGLPALVDRWLALDETARERERRLVKVPLTIQAAARSGQATAIDVAFAAASEDVDAAPWSIAAWGIVAEYANSLRRRGAEAKAGDAFARAAERAAGLGAARREGGCWDEAARIAFDADRMDLARARATKAADGYLRCGDVGRAAVVRTNLARIDLREGRLASAAEVVAVARREALESKDPKALAESAATLAEVLCVRGEVGACREAFAEAIRAADATGNRTEAMRLRFRHAQSLLESDDWPGALDAFTELSSALRPTDPLPLRFLVPKDLAILLRTLGRFEDAVAPSRAALEVARESGDADHVGEAEADLAFTLSRLGRHEEAAALLRARGDAARPSDLEGLARAEWGRGRAEDAIEAIRRAIRGYEQQDLRSLATDARRTLARILLDTGRRDEALAELARIRGAAPATGTEAPSSTSFLAAVAGAESLLAEGRPSEAAAEALRALRIHRALARGLATEDALGTRAEAGRLSNLGLLAASRWAAAEPGAATAAAALAFELVESSRAFLLARGLRSPAALLWASLPPELVAADRDSRHELEVARTKALGVSLAALTGVRRGEPDAADDLAKARARRDEVLVRIGRAAGRVTSFLDPPLPDLPRLRASLAEEEAFVLLQDAGDTIHGIVVRRGGARFVTLPADGDLRARIAGFERLVSTPGADDAAAAARVHDAIWRPLEVGLAGARRVVVSADGALAWLPFDALLTREGGRAVRLVERLELSSAPSAGVFLALLEERAVARGDRAVAVGDPDLGAAATGLGRLPGGAAEAKDVAGRFREGRARLLLDTEASVDAVLAALAPEGGRLAVAHFACHGVADPSSPGGSGLVLAGGRLLDADRLARARVPADLVTLSACDSGRGLLARGEGVFGLPRAFLLAGASRVVTSAWLVSDRDARLLMKDFYDAHLGRGLPVAQALREAKLAALRAGGDRAHPARWAAFTSFGLR